MPIITGNVMTVSGSFAVDGVAADPAGTIQIEFKDPTGVVTTYTYPTDPQLVKDSTGVYHAGLACNVAGNWVGKVIAGPGTGQAAGEVGWVIAASQIP